MTRCSRQRPEGVRRSPDDFKSVLGRESHKWLLERKNEYDLISHARALAEKEILLIGGWQDRTATIEHYVLPLYRSLQKSGAENLKIIVYETDHSFKNVRDTIASEIISWIKGNN